MAAVTFGIGQSVECLARHTQASCLEMIPYNGMETHRVPRVLKEREISDWKGGAGVGLLEKAGGLDGSG